MKLDGTKVRWYRDRLGWTLDILAEKAEVAKGTVLRAEHEEDIRPGSGRRIARALGVEIPDLIPERPGTASPLGASPLSAEWAHRADSDLFGLAIKDAPSEELRELGAALVADFSRVRTRNESLEEGPVPKDQHVTAFSRAGGISEELARRGEEPLEQYVLALKRFKNALSGGGEEATRREEEDQEHRAG